MKIFDQTLGLLSKALDARMARHGVLAGNVANANTPGYAPKDVPFSLALSQEMAAPSAPQAAGSSAGFIPVESASAPIAMAGPVGMPAQTSQTGTSGIDQNKVDVDKAMVTLAENAIQYNAAAKAATKKLAILRYVASDGNA